MLPNPHAEHAEDATEKRKKEKVHKLRPSNSKLNQFIDIIGSCYLCSYFDRLTFDFFEIQSLVPLILVCGSHSHVWTWLRTQQNTLIKVVLQCLTSQMLGETLHFTNPMLSFQSPTLNIMFFRILRSHALTNIY